MTFLSSVDFYDNSILLSYEGNLHENSIYDFIEEQVEIRVTYPNGESKTQDYWVDYVTQSFYSFGNESGDFTEIKLYVDDSYEQDLYFSDATSVDLIYTKPAETSDQLPAFAEISDLCSPAFIESFSISPEIDQGSKLSEFRIEYIELYYLPETLGENSTAGPETWSYDYGNQAFLAWFSEPFDTNALGDGPPASLFDIYAELSDGSTTSLNGIITDSGAFDGNQAIYIDFNEADFGDDTSLETFEDIENIVFEYTDPSDQDDTTGLFQSNTGADAPSEIFKTYDGGYFWNPSSYYEFSDAVPPNFNTGNDDLLYDGFRDSYGGEYIQLIEISQRSDDNSFESSNDTTEILDINSEIAGPVLPGTGNLDTIDSNSKLADPVLPGIDDFEFFESNSELGEFTDLELSPTVINYFTKFVPGSELSDGVFTTPSFEINSASLQFQGSLDKDSSSLAGFDSLELGSGINLPSGGLFLTSGRAKVPAENTEPGYTGGRNQGGNADLSKFAKDAFPDTYRTFDSSIIKFDFTPTDDTESIFLDLVFASDEYYEFKNSSFVDIGAIWFDNQESPINFADFDGENEKPLSIVS